MAWEVYAEPENKDAVKIANNAIDYAKKNGKKTVIVDTAGRLAIDEEMMKEISSLKSALKPSETLFVVDSMTGQDAVNIAKSFDERLDVGGVVLTKMDGDARGGAALSIRSITGKPIKFIGVGEKLSDLEAFHPDRMASRILGMGDVLTMIEKAQEVVDEKQAVELEKKLRKNQFTLEDFRDQMRQIRKNGIVDGHYGHDSRHGKDEADEKTSRWTIRNWSTSRPSSIQ